MGANFEAYERAKQAVYMKKGRAKSRDDMDLDEFDEPAAAADGKIGATDVLQVGSKVVIGGGLGLLGGIAAVAVAAGAAEVVVAAAATKIAGAVGGALGLSMGLKDIDRKKRLRARGDE